MEETDKKYNIDIETYTIMRDYISANEKALDLLDKLFVKLIPMLMYPINGQEFYVVFYIISQY
jgi:hypothetical protein